MIFLACQKMQQKNKYQKHIKNFFYKYKIYSVDGYGNLYYLDEISCTLSPTLDLSRKKDFITGIKELL